MDAFVALPAGLSPQVQAPVAAQALRLRASAAQPEAPTSSGSGFALTAFGFGLAALGLQGSARQVKSGSKAARYVKTSAVARRAAAVGDAIPNIGLDKGFPPEKVMLADYCKGKKVVLVGLPGAFTPT
eukprot:TRINITY_DN5390_c0_g1_i1.p1 TRINITY_DN5390_c0_g1~~TRINITY_DN5390_c0_g1_i1.p1  ORF type:complete len:128 (+),score=35.11 TRINITY_DN5390_c0_g1_i1:59-442(+)